MLRRNRRLAKQYCFRQSKETLDRTKYEKKRKITASIQEGKPIPNELPNEEAKLRQEIDLQDDNTAVLWTHIDDESAKASNRDPKILLTTSRGPSAPLLQFMKELKLVFPNAQVLNRGGQVLSEIVESCCAHDYSDVVLVHDERGKPNCLIVCHLPYGPTAYFQLCNVVPVPSEEVLFRNPEDFKNLESLEICGGELTDAGVKNLSV